MNNQELFKEKKYLKIENFMAKELCSVSTLYALFDEKNNFSSDPQVPNAHAKYGDFLMESILIHSLPVIQKNVGIELYPTYSYYRVYRNGDELKPHRDRPSCEISATVCLGFYYGENSNFSWPIKIENKPIFMNAGDLVVYRGVDLTHSRDILVAEKEAYHVQCFLHYVDKNGPYREFKFDERGSIGTKAFL